MKTWPEFNLVELHEPTPQTHSACAVWSVDGGSGVEIFSIDYRLWQSIPQIHEQVWQVIRKEAKAHAQANGCILNKVTRPHLTKK